MTAPAVPDGLEPLAVWDAHDRVPSSFAAVREERSEWARAHLGDPAFIYRVEFYVLAAPFARVHRYKRHARGFKYYEPETGDVAREAPIIMALAELPPARLLRTS